MSERTVELVLEVEPRRPVGRPPILTPGLLSAIRELRDTKKPDGTTRTWNEISRQVRSPAGSLRKWYAASRRQTSRAINPDPEFSPPGDAP